LNGNARGGRLAAPAKRPDRATIVPHIKRCLEIMISKLEVLNLPSQQFNTLFPNMTCDHAPHFRHERRFMTRVFVHERSAGFRRVTDY
jgi:hypothetical protein